MLTPKLTQTIIQADCVFVPQAWLEKDWNQNLCGASFDTRTLKKEQIFFCWKSELVKKKIADGHSYLSKLIGSSILYYANLLCDRLNLVGNSFPYS